MIVLFALVLAALSASGKVIFTKPGDTVTLDCGVSDSNNLRWSHEGELILSVSGRDGYPRKGSSPIKNRCTFKSPNLVVKGVTEADSGRFTCQAGGHTQELTLVVFSAHVSPSSHLQVGSEAELRCKANPAVEVQWQGPDGSVRANSAVVPLAPVSLRDAGTWKFTLSISGNAESGSLEVAVTDPRLTTLSPPSRISGEAGVPPGEVDNPKSAPPLGIPWWMWAVIGGGALVAVLLAVLVVFMCRRVRRRRRLTRKMKNGLQFRAPLQYCQCDGPTAAAKPQQRRQRAKPSAPPQQTLLVE